MSTDFCVTDASVLLKWYLHEEEPYRAQSLLLFDRFRAGSVRIVLPELALLELGNRLTRLAAGGLQLFEDSLDLLTDIVPLEPGDLKLIARYVVSLHESGMDKITVYDCAYIHVARLTDAPLITADRLQAAAARSWGMAGVLIEDYV